MIDDNFIPHVEWLRYLYNNIESGFPARLVGPENQNIVTTPFNELLTSEKTTIIELKSIYGISNLRDAVTTIGAGAVTNDHREYQINVSGANALARLSSRKRGRYIAGKSAEYGIGVRTDNGSVTGDTVAKWGALNNTNGMYYGIDSTGIFVGVLDNTVETKIYQTDWNLDKLDGTGLSEINLNSFGTVGTDVHTNDGIIYQVEYTWYGYGVITFKMQIKTINGVRTIPVHRYIVDGKTSIENPNLPLTALVEQTTATNNISLYVSGRQFSILGSYSPSYRLMSEYRIGQSIPVLGTNPTPMIAFKQKQTYLSVDAIFDGVEITTDNKIIFEVYIADESAITGGTYVAPTRKQPSETAFETNTSATGFDITNANILYRGEVIGGSGRQLNEKDLNNIFLDIPEDKILVLSAFSTGTTATVDSILRIREEW